MPYLYEKPRRLLIPRWRNYENTVLSGELKVSGQVERVIVKPEEISEQVYAWNKNKTLIYASDLFSAAYVLGIEKEIPEVVNFILKNAHENSSIHKLAEKISKTSDSKDLTKDISPTTSGSLPIADSETYHSNIRNLRRSLVANPYNPIRWMDLAFYYLLEGHLEKSEKAVNVSLKLAPDNRYILRSASRFFLQIKEKDKAHRVLRRSPNVKFDPWLLSAEITTSAALDRTSTLIKNGISIIQSEAFLPSEITELSGAIGTLEMEAGNFKNARKLFISSLVQHNENSLAQAQWASDELPNFVIDIQNSNLLKKYEAQSYYHLSKGNFQESYNYSIEWLKDQPFSKLPIIFATHILRDYLDKPEMCISLGELGLKTNPKDNQLLNNIAYDLAMEGNTDKALEYFSRIDAKTIDGNSNLKVAITATSGLLFYRTGYIDLGRTYYKEAVDIAKSDKVLRIKALINYAREEILINSQESHNLLKQVEKEANNIDDLSVKIAIDNLKEYYKKNNKFYHS